jgi:hypothetical protein
MHESRAGHLDKVVWRMLQMTAAKPRRRRQAGGRWIPLDAKRALHSLEKAENARIILARNWVKHVSRNAF